MKDHYTLGMGEPRERKPWPSGGSLVVPLPRAWKKQYDLGEFPVYVDESDDGESFVISKKPDPLGRTLQATYVSKSDNPLELEATVFGYYMRGDKSVSIHVPITHIYSAAAADNIPKKLHGVIQHQLNSEDTLLEFQELGTDIEESVIKNGEKIKETYHTTLNAMKNFPEDKSLAVNILTSDRNEEWLDKESFYWKRQLNKAILDNTVLRAMGLKDRLNVLHYDSVVYNTERMSDLYKEIAHILERLTKIKAKGSVEGLLHPFTAYLDESATVVNDAFKIFAESGNSKLTRQKHFDPITGLDYTDSYGLDKVTKLVDYINQQPQYARYLSILQSRIWGIRGNAMNLIEAKLNMS